MMTDDLITRIGAYYRAAESTQTPVAMAEIIGSDAVGVFDVESGSGDGHDDGPVTVITLDRDRGEREMSKQMITGIINDRKCVFIVF